MHAARSSLEGRTNTGAPNGHTGNGTGGTEMKVWIDQDLCTGDGLCEEIAPDVFTLLDDGLAYVKEGAKVFSDPGGPEGLANVPAGMEEATIESAEECPGECIFIEVE
jgi:ferredoxin